MKHWVLLLGLCVPSSTAEAALLVDQELAYGLATSLRLEASERQILSGFYEASVEPSLEEIARQCRGE